MEVNLNPGQSVNAETAQPVARPTQPQTVTPAMSFERTSALESRLQQVSSLRPEKVLMASSLAADPNYPSENQMTQLAGLLASKLGQSSIQGG